MTDTAVIFNRILQKLENDEKILTFKDPATDFHVWPFVRHKILFHLLFTQRAFTEVGQGNISTKMDWLRTFWFMVTSNPLRLFFTRKKIIVFSGGISNVKKDGRYLNRLADYFYFLRKKQMVLLEDPLFSTYALPRAHSDVYANLFLRLIALVWAKLFPVNKKQVAHSLDHFFSLIASKLQGESFDVGFMNDLQLMMRHRLQRNVKEYRLYKTLFRIARPSLIMMEDAAYGPKAHVIRAAHETGIKVAEYQHGFINATHLAYNYGPVVKESSSYSVYLPDYYLSYGKYWSDSINMPVKKVVIGNPHLSESIKNMNGQEEKDHMLILGGGADPKPLIDLVLLLKEKVGDRFRLTFRPHPLEWPKVDVTYAELIQNGIAMDLSSNMYASIITARVIVGELSTAIFEAKPFNKSAYIIPNTYSKSFGAEIFEFFPSLDQGLADGFKTGDRNASNSELLWKSDWQQNFDAFVDMSTREY